MRLAEAAARESVDMGRGADLGVVMVERAANGGEKVVIVAGDARYAGLAAGGQRSRGNGMTCGGRGGNPAGHAVMRAIEIVAAKRRSQRLDVGLKSGSAVSLTRTRIPNDLSSLETHFFSTTDTEQCKDNHALEPNGYLCLNLTVYVTHEPCIACGMALVHSRVSGIIFRRPSTDGRGALTVVDGADAEMDEVNEGMDGEEREQKSELPNLPERQPFAKTSRGPGLFWREDLNWRFPCWRFASE